jgi:hypothetical protein
MPDLNQSLKNEGLGRLLQVAELWSLSIQTSNPRSARESLVVGMLDPALIRDMLDGLSEVAAAALEDLATHQGRLDWPVFSLRYGDIRPMGPARAARETPWKTPQSPAEALWFRALIHRAFFDTPEGLQEFAYIPDDLLLYLARPRNAQTVLPGRPAIPAEYEKVRGRRDRILDDITAYLVALRLEQPDRVPASPRRSFIHAMLRSLDLIDENDRPRPEAVRAFLALPRDQAMSQVVQDWLVTPSVDEVRMLPGLQAEGTWTNEPLRVRLLVLSWLDGLPAASWWSLESLVSGVRNHHPHFQRPDGDYGSWFLKDTESGSFLHGVDNWDRVEGDLIRYLVSGPLFWLGILQLGGDRKPSWPNGSLKASAFRFSPEADELLSGQAPAGFNRKENQRVYVRTDGRIGVPHRAPRAARYQIARFASWQGEKGGEFRYQLTPSSLELAREQGLRLKHLFAIFQNHTDGIPPNVSKALWAWEETGAGARIESLIVLRLGDPAMLDALRKSRAGRFLGDILGPAAVAIKPGAEIKVLETLAELGWLGEIESLGGEA